MTYKEWEAAIMVLGAAVISIWVTYQAINSPLHQLDALAARLVWAIAYVVLFNIAATIVVTILISAARREEFKDERADERDRFVGARSMRNGYLICSIGGAGSLLLLAIGAEPTIAIYVLFGGLMLAGAADAVSRLYYYRVG